MQKLIKADWQIRDLSIPVGRSLVRRFHYARGASNTRTYLHGLFAADAFWEADCVGAAWWIPPTKSAALATYPENWQGVLCLSRLVIKPDVPSNAASYLIGRSIRLIDRSRWPCLVTYADSWQGHDGAIYKATNWTEVGRTKPERTYVQAGRMLSRKAGGKTRTHSEMLALGAECIGSFSRIKFVMKSA